MPELVKAPFYSDLAGVPPDGTIVWRKASDGVRLRIGAWKGGTKGTFYVLSGRSEYLEKYGPTFQRLLDLGYSVVSCDWRGQGLSERLDADKKLGHVRKFEDYQKDMAAMMQLAADLRLPRTRYILAHSMGGAIALRGIYESLIVKKVIFTAPFWDAYLSSGLRAYANVVTAIAPSIGFAGTRTPTTFAEAYVERAPFIGNPLTNDPDNYAWLQKHAAKHPELVVGGPSLGWLKEALDEVRFFQSVSMDLPDCLCFVGTNEHIVSPKAIKRMMKRWKNGELVEIPGAQHELLLETPEVQDLIWSKIAEFLNG